MIRRGCYQPKATTVGRGSHPQGRRAFPRRTMTRFYPRDHKVIHSSWGREIVDNHTCGRAPGLWFQRDSAPLRGHAQGSGVRGSNDLRGGRSDRRFLGFVEPRVSLVDRPPLASLASLNGCLGLNRIITRRGARDDGQGSGRDRCQQGPVWTSVRRARSVVLRTTPRAGGRLACGFGVLR